MPSADENALRAIRAASTALQKWWPEGESPRSWRGVTWGNDWCAKELDFKDSRLEVLAPKIGQLTALTKLSLAGCPLKELPPQIGQLTALTDLDLGGCPLKKLPPQMGQLLALTNLNLDSGDELILAPGVLYAATTGTIVAAYAPLLIVDPLKDTPEELLAFLRANPLAVPPFFQSILTAAAHAAWLSKAVKETPDLAKFTDNIGRRAVDVAHPACKRAMQAALFLLRRFDVDDGPPEHRSATSVVIRADDHAGKPDYAKIFEDADTNKNGMLELNELDAVAKKLGLSKDLVESEATKQRSATSAGGDQACTPLSKDEFVSACKRLLGDRPRKVVIKLMKEKVQWQREMTSRSWEWDAAANKYMPSQNKVTLDPQYAVQALDAPTQAEMTDAVHESQILQDLAEKYMENASIKKYVYPVVMDAANRNLAQIFMQERPGTDALRDLARQMFEAVQHLHSRKLMHGDLKTLNMVRSVMDNKLRLIDFDASGTIFGYDEEGESYACAKFSSGVLPPEALYELTGEERRLFDAYWAVIKDKDPVLWAKVQPKSSKHGGEYVVKTFRTGDNDAKPIKDGLPYELLPASASLDMWSLGVMLYLLFTGETLVPVTRDDDFLSGTGMGTVHNWNHEKRREKLSKMDHPAAHDLVSQLLSSNPTMRSEKSLEQLLKEHSFFNPKHGDIELQEKLDSIQEEVKKVREEQDKQTTLLRVIKDLSTENKIELRHTREALMKGIFEATEVQTPTTFIVLNAKLPALPTKEEKDELMQIAEDGSGVTVNGGHASVKFTEDGPRFEAKGKCKEYVEHLNTGVKWVNRLKTVGSKVAAGEIGVAFKTIKEGLGDLVTGETMYLYLVDELKGEPVRAEGYPIPITTPSDIVPKLLPAMQVGLRAMSIFNGAAGIARMVGYPVPKVPEALTKGVRESVNMLKKKSSVEEFDVVQEVVDKGGEKKSDSLRGHSLRVFTDFLQENDPGLKAGNSGHFAGLRRIGDPNSGTALWTTLTDTQEINNALEARTREREAELRAGNKYIQEQAAGIARTPSEEANDVETLRAELKAAREEEAKARAEAETARREAEAAQLAMESLARHETTTVASQTTTEKAEAAERAAAEKTEAEAEAKAERAAAAGCCKWWERTADRTSRPSRATTSRPRATTSAE